MVTCFRLSFTDGDNPNRLLMATLMKVHEYESEVLNDKSLFVIKKSNIEGYSYMVKRLKSKLPLEYHIKVSDTWDYDIHIEGVSHYSVYVKTKVLERDEYDHLFKSDFNQLNEYSVTVENDGEYGWYTVRLTNAKVVR